MGDQARRVYITLSVVTGAASTLAFTITTLYRLRVAGLDPFQLVIVGTVMEACVFAFEVPTGIVADVYSRKLSIVIGHVGMGLGFALDGTAASFPGVLAGQALWGIAYTFTSGATTAWIAGELGEPDERALSSLFLRTSQWSSAMTVLMIPLSFLLGSASLRAPLLAAGGIQVVLGLWLGITMPEEHFERATAEDRSTWAHMVDTARRGFGAIRASRVLVMLVGLIVISGAASEAYDRFDVPQLLGPVGLPTGFGGSTLIWLGILSTTSAALGIVVARVVRRMEPAKTRRRLGRWIWWLYAVHVVGLVVFAFSGSFVVAFLAVLLINRARSVRFSLFGSWLVPLTPKAQRATTLSAIEQADAIGQISIGPLFGVIGRAASIPVALAVSAGTMAPGLRIIRRASRQAQATQEAQVAAAPPSAPSAPSALADPA
jgi:DHA3 family tetracycline resistance protein-like MFS transporter